jgi:VanZ family protein
LAQYYLPGRVSAADDVYANVTGTALGALIGTVAAGSFRWAPIRAIAADRAAALLLALWLGYRLYPYVPTIDLHKYWEALKPVILHPRPALYDLFRYAAIWLTIGSLLEALAGPRPTKLLIPLFFAGVLAAKVLIIGKTLSAPEVTGAIVALVAWLILASTVGLRLRIALTSVFFTAYIVAERLAPFEFTPYRRPFGWVPFRSLLYGSLELNIMSFLEKTFLYGTLIWLLGKCGLGLRVSTMLVAIMLFATSWAETRLPARSAEITDALMALLIGAVIVAMTGPAQCRTPGPAGVARQS